MRFIVGNERKKELHVPPIEPFFDSWDRCWDYLCEPADKSILRSMSSVIGAGLHWRMLQMETFLENWDRHWDHVSKKADKMEDEAVLETQDWWWEQPQTPWDPDIDGHTKSDATTIEDKDTGEGGCKGRNKEGGDRYELWDELNAMR